MNIAYVTLYNNMTFMIKPSYKSGRWLYCHYWYNNMWIPSILDMYSVVNISYMNPNESTMPMYNNIYQGYLEKYPNKYRAPINSGSELLMNTSGGFKPMAALKGVSGGAQPGYGTVIAPVFPKIDPNWFYTGFPTKLTVGNANGALIDYIPIFFYATKDGNEKFTLPKLPDRVGYLDQNNKFTETLVWNGPFKKGNLLFTLLLDKNDPACKGSTIDNTSYWNLLTEFSNIDPGSTASKSISITSGITKQESYSMSLTIGSKVAVEVGIEGIGKISTELSAQLSSSFGGSVSITSQITTTDTVNFKAQDRTQRISTYQFVEQYKIGAADPLKAKVNVFNDPNRNYVANFAKAGFEPRPFDYQSRYFAKAFVLEPTS
ncbi:hypothetical protein [Clostridium niameyense]|uniref:hypothetical protein n=1 Tax=Clostridium niameyense TaxID=1622073 RepID=UPI00067F65CC|nr:hypothetical protein [Clostridium niameyense]